MDITSVVGLHAEALATLGTPGVENFASTTSGHSRAEPMGSLALDVARLKGSFHGCFVLLGLAKKSFDNLPLPNVDRDLAGKRERDCKNGH